MKGDLEAILLLVISVVAVIVLSKAIPGPMDRDRLNQMQINGRYAR